MNRKGVSYSGSVATQLFLAKPFHRASATTSTSSPAAAMGKETNVYPWCRRTAGGSSNNSWTVRDFLLTPWARLTVLETRRFWVRCAMQRAEKDDENGNDNFFLAFRSYYSAIVLLLFALIVSFAARSLPYPSSAASPYSVKCEQHSRARVLFLYIPCFRQSSSMLRLSRK